MTALEALKEIESISHDEHGNLDKHELWALLDSIRELAREGQGKQ